MIVREFETARVIVGSLDYESDLLDNINKICVDNNIRAGFINIIGAIFNLKIGYFKQDKKEYVYLDNINPDEPLEIASCSGNISIRDDKPFAHLHIIGTDRDGKCFGGHLMPGTKIYAAEFYIQEILGDDLIRELDSKTKLPLWRN